MDEITPIEFAGSGNNAESAKRAAETFVEVYQVTLIRIEEHLDTVIEDAGAEYADGYKPWQEAVHNLVHGTFLLSKETAKPDEELLSDALRVFSFESSTEFLHDLCTILGIKTEDNWQEKFRGHVHNLLSSLDVIPKKRPLIRAPYEAYYAAIPSST